MPYINSDGSVTESRTWFRISIFSDIFWAFANEIGYFFRTMLDPNAPPPKNRIADGRANPSSGSAPKKDDSGSGYVRRGPNIRTLPKACTTNR